eukprot:4448515-Lingulodinium_polyedra.AAC.1
MVLHKNDSEQTIFIRGLVLTGLVVQERQTADGTRAALKRVVEDAIPESVKEQFPSRTVLAVADDNKANWKAERDLQDLAWGDGAPY